MVIMIMIKLNACFDDGFVIAVPVTYDFRFIIGSGESVTHPNTLSNWLKAVLLIDGGMRIGGWTVFVAA